MTAETGIKRWLDRGGIDPFSLRTKLLIFSLALVVVPGVVFALLAFSSARDALERAVGRQLAEVARDAADTIGEIEAAELQNVQTWARQDLMRELLIGDVDKRISRFLLSLRAGEPAYRRLLCVDAGGVVIAATEPSALGASHRDEPWFRAARDGAALVLGPRPEGARREPLLDIAAPVRHPDDARKIVGVLLLEYDWRHVSSLLEPLRENLAELGSRIEIAVLDERGVVRASAGESARGALLGQDLRAAGWRSAAAATGAKARRRGFHEEPAAESLVGFSGLDAPRADWRVLVLQPLSEALAPVRTMQRRWTMLLIAVVLVGLGIAALSAGRIVRPLRALTEATRELARFGEARRVVPVRSRDEIGELSASFNTMAGELRRAREDLVNAAKFAFVGELAAGVAHEVRTPLGVLRTSAQVLGKSLPEAESKNRELATMMIEEVDRLERVVAGLLELARPRPLEVEATRLDDVLARAVEFVETQAAEKDIAISADLSVPQSAALCDGEQIYQVALNLVFNAVQILPRGGRIWISTTREKDGMVGFSVRDDGPGIAAELHERIFSPFFTTREDGTGLGLALVRRVVEAHHGTISLDSAPGRGTMFTVALPTAPGE